jgi:hypothetical protein
MRFARVSPHKGPRAPRDNPPAGGPRAAQRSARLLSELYCGREPRPPAGLRYSDADVGRPRFAATARYAFRHAHAVRLDLALRCRRPMPLGRAGEARPVSRRDHCVFWQSLGDSIHQILAVAPNSLPIVQFRCELISIKPRHGVLAWYWIPSVASIRFCCRALFEHRSRGAARAA